MAKGTVHLWNVILIGAGMVAFFIGAGFASGQEILQFFVTYGSRSIIAVAAVAFILIWTSVSYTRAGYENRFGAVKNIYYYYGGRYVGLFFDLFIAVYCYGSFFYMAAAAATVANTTFGVSKIIGSAALGILVICTVIFGFDTLAKIMGYSGIVNIALILIVTIYTLAGNWQHIPDGVRLIERGLAEVTRGGSDNPVLGGVAYIGGTALWFAVFLSELAARRPRRDMRIGAVAGSIFITGMIILSTLTLFSILPEVAAADVPNLVIANRITPAAGVFFTIIIILEVYNTSAPQMWTVVSRISPDENSNQFRVATVVLVVLGVAVATVIPFKTLVGYVLSTTGYVCYIFFAAVILKDIGRWLTRR